MQYLGLHSKPKAEVHPEHLLMGPKEVAVTEERSREGSKTSRPDHRNAVHVEGRNKTDTINNRGSWNHLRIIQTAMLGTARILQKVLM
jgi:hypothetical protein